MLSLLSKIDENKVIDVLINKIDIESHKAQAIKLGSFQGTRGPKYIVPASITKIYGIPRQLKKQRERRLRLIGSILCAKRQTDHSIMSN